MKIESGEAQYHKARLSIIDDVNESGELQYERFSLKARWLRVLANLDGLLWVLRKLWRDGD